MTDVNEEGRRGAAIGAPAPDFTLRAGVERTLTLSGLRGAPVVLVFYPADWSPVCGDQVSLYSEMLPEFTRYHAHLLGISVDGVWCHAAFASARNLKFPLLADFEPKGRVSRLYGAYEPVEGVSQRALFVIDGEGILRWDYFSPMDVNPGADGILEALEALSARGGGEP